MTQLAIAALIALFTALLRPHFVLVLLLMLSSTLIDARSMPYLFGFSLVEWCLMFLLGLVVLSGLSSRAKDAFVRTPLDWPILLFSVASFISVFNAVNNLGTIHSFRTYEFRALLGYLVFFAVTNLIRTRRQLMTLVGAMFVMATVVATFINAQQVIGPEISIIPGQTQVYTADALGQRLDGVARVSIPGAIIVFVMLLPAFVLHATPAYLKGRKWLSLIPVLFLPPGIAFTFDRNMWIGIMLGGVAFIPISRFESRRFVSLVLTLVLLAALLTSVLNVYFPRADTIVQGLSARFDSLFAGDELVYDSSTQGRLQENQAAIPKIKEYPVLGVGPGGEYRAPDWNTRNTAHAHFIHNAYVYLLLDLGILGFLPFVWFSLAFLIRGISAWHTSRDPILRGIVMGFTLSYVALLVASVAAPWFVTHVGIPLVGVMLGINEVAIRLEQQSFSVSDSLI
jgi:O-antigen ligase